MKRIAACFAIGLMTLSAARGEVIKHGPVTLDVPAGWKMVSQKGMSLVLQSTKEEDLADRGNVMIYVQPSPPADIEKKLAELTRGAAKEEPDPKRVNTGRTAEGFLAKDTIASGRIKAGKPGNQKEMRVRAKIAVIQGKTQFVGMTLLTFNGNNWRQDDAFEEIVRAVKLSDQPVATVPPATKQDLSGLYGKFGVEPRIQPMGGMQIEATRDYLYFQPGGFVFNDLPPADQINKPDVEKLRREKWRNAGAYSYDGAKLTLSFPNEYGFLVDETQPLIMEDKGLKIGDPSHQKLGPEKDRRLNGTFRSFFYTGGDGSTGISGGVASEKFLKLKPDGTYEQQGTVSVAMSVEGGDSRTGIAGNKKKPADRGTYKIDGYTITFTPAGGEPMEMTFYATDQDGMIVLNDTPYLNQDKKDKK